MAAGALKLMPNIRCQQRTQKLVTSLVLTSQAVVFHSCAMLLEPLWVREPMYVTQTFGVLFTPSLESL